MRARILITGAQGFIGHNLARHLKRLGHDVKGTSSQPSSTDDWILPYRFGDAISSTIFSDIDAVIHLAHDTRALALTIEATQALSEGARKSGVQYQIFVSSISAASGVESGYATSKRQIEDFFRGFKDCAIIRPGLVLGRGGLFGRILNVVDRCPVVPLLDGGRQPMPVIALEDLLTAIERLLGERLSGEFNLFESYTLMQLLREYASQHCLRRTFVPFPAQIASGVVGAVEALGLRLPISSENIKGFVKNQSLDLSSDLNRLLGSERNLAAALRSV